MPTSSFCHGVLPLFLIMAINTAVPALSDKSHRASDKLEVNISSFVALGDSYASGIDAGSQLDSRCWRYSQSYPAQLNSTDLLKGFAPTMQFLACSGTVMTNDWGPDTSANMGKKKEIWGQIDAMNDADFVTLSIGGNDAGFFEVLNACLFKFYGPAAPSCEKTRKRALHRIKSQKFNSTYNAMLDSILERHPASSFRIFANGYSRFFDDALTSECNHISLGYWTGFQPRLTVELRRSLNELCDLLNERIGLIIQERNDERVIWVNWAPRFNQHRLCRPGKGLLDGESWFYGVGFRGRSSDPIEGDDCDSAGDFESRALCDIAIAFANHPQMEPVSEDFQVTWGREFFGPKYARVFHPTPDGYKAIVDQILEVCPYASAATVLGANINTEE